MILIGFVGKMQAGKTTAAKILKGYGFHRVAFGDILKQMVLEAGILTAEQIKEKDEYSRFMLQHIATDIIRKVNPDYFVKQMQYKINRTLQYKHDKIVIDDIRFQNEAELVRRNAGKLVLINRNGYRGVSTNPELEKHQSEVELESIAVSMVIFNKGTLEEYENKIRATAEEYGWLRGK